MEIVVLSSTQAISDLLDRRSAIYSDKVRVPRRAHWISTIHDVPLPAVHSDDRVVSSFDRWLVINLISPSLRDAGWEPANILCLLCLTGHDGVFTGSYLTILPTFQRPRTTISTRSNQCQLSSQTFSESQKLSRNTLVCTHSTPCNADAFDSRCVIQTHWLAGFLDCVWYPGGHPGQRDLSHV